MANCKASAVEYCMILISLMGHLIGVRYPLFYHVTIQDLFVMGIHSYTP